MTHIVGEVKQYVLGKRPKYKVKGTRPFPHLGWHSTLETSADQLAVAEQYLFPQPWLYLYNFWCKTVLVNNCVGELSNVTCCNQQQQVHWMILE